MENILNNTCEILIGKNYDEIILDKKYDKAMIITDENVEIHQLEKFKDSIVHNNQHIKDNIITLVIRDGEESKTLKVYEEVIAKCINENLSRKSVILALGGGVVGDLAGFVASTYMRGIDVLQIPTTLLSQVDSSIGGKTGINLGNYKNVIGSFYQPTLTYINTQALQTLPEEEFISAMSEVIKYGVIYDYKFLEYLDINSENIKNREEEYIYEIVKKCATIKAQVVDQDEKESGIRKILNFGHTFGHGVEKLLSINHGKAISIGMHMAFKMSLSENLIDENYYNQFVNICKKYIIITEKSKERTCLSQIFWDKCA